jgi:glycosyltransferase involved in cell wall biosynthesis
MHIGIDARMLENDSMHGIARYVHELIKNIIESAESAYKYFIFVAKDFEFFKSINSNNISFIHTKSKWLSIREQYELSALIKKYKIDLFHATSFVVPYFCNCKLLITIHDLNHLVRSKDYKLAHRLYYKMIVVPKLKKAAGIITVSEYSKKELVNHLDIPKEKILLTYNGISDFNLFRDTVTKKTPKDFIFALASHKPHKNTLTLIQAYIMSTVCCPLVLLGSLDKQSIQLVNSHNKGKKKEIIIISQNASDSLLCELYSRARVFVFPSFFEGFGLPPLEALACNTRVISSNATSMPEILGKWPIYFDPTNIQQLIIALDNCHNLSSYTDFEKEGIAEHIKKFSWARMTKQTQAIYSNCLG